MNHFPSDEHILKFHFNRSASHCKIEHMIENMIGHWLVFVHVLNWMVGPTPIDLKFEVISLDTMRFILNHPDYLDVGPTNLTSMDYIG